MKSFFKLFLIAVLFFSCRPYEKVVYQPGFSYQIDSTHSASAEYEQMIAPYRDGLSAEMNKVIGECPQFLMKSKPSSALGSFMADAMVSEMKYYKFKADFGIVNYGGIRGVIDSGAITVGQIFQVMPFENEVIILKIDKVQLQQIIDLIKSKGGEPFSKELLNLKEQEYYWLAASDYIANGGDGYTMLPNAYKRINTGIKLRNVLIEHITRVNKIKVDNSPRVL